MRPASSLTVPSPYGKFWCLKTQTANPKEDSLRTCTDCNGKRYHRCGFLWLFTETCTTCKGTGEVPEVRPSSASMRPTRSPSVGSTRRQDARDDNSVPALLSSIDDGTTSAAGPSADDKHAFGGGHSGGAGASGSWSDDHPTHHDSHHDHGGHDHSDSHSDSGGGDSGGGDGGGD